MPRPLRSVATHPLSLIQGTVSMAVIASVSYQVTASHAHQDHSRYSLTGCEPWQRNGKRKGVKAK